MARFHRAAHKRERRNKIIMGVVVIVIMVSSALAIINSNSDSAGGNPTDYNGFRFSQQGDKWVVKVNRQLLAFNYHPLEVEHINVSRDILSAINSTNPLRITNNPYSTNGEYIAAAEYQFRTYNEVIFGKAVINGFTMEAAAEVPVITCANATIGAPVIYFTDGNQTLVSMENSCIIVQAQYNTDYFRLVDRILYSLVGIMG